MKYTHYRMCHANVIILFALSRLFIRSICLCCNFFLFPIILSIAFERNVILAKSHRFSHSKCANYFCFKMKIIREREREKRLSIKKMKYNIISNIRYNKITWQFNKKKGRKSGKYSRITSTYLHKCKSRRFKSIFHLYATYSTYHRVFTYRETKQRISPASFYPAITLKPYTTRIYRCPQILEHP